MRLLAEDVGCEVYHHANRTTKHNAVKNGVRSAPVPFGNSCAFCLMLSTRGFVYLSWTSAGEDKGHYHAHCRCKIVTDKKGAEIKGYDPEGLNYRIQKVAQQLGISNFNWQDCMRNPAMQAVLQRYAHTTLTGCSLASRRRSVTAKTLKKTTAYEKSRTTTIQKRTSKSVVMSGATYSCTICLRGMGTR